MKGLIAVNGYFENASTLAQERELKAELGARGAACDVIKTNALGIGVRGGEAYADADGYDFCVFLDKDVTAARLLETTGLRLFNTAEAVRLCDDKMLTFAALCGKGINMPETISSPLMYGENDDPAFLDGVERRLGYPVVVKKIYGSMGRGVFLAKNRAELDALFVRLRMEPHLYQKFTGRGGEDYRVIVIGGRAVAAMKRVNENDFRSNIELGGEGTAVGFTEDLRFVAERAAASLGLDYAGVDILEENGKLFLCEVNSNAFFSGIERATGKNVAAIYAEHIVKNIRK